MSDTYTGVMERATRAMAERLDYELRGAWRAGYDYVHVYDEPPSPPESGTFALRRYVLPTDEERPPRPSSLIYRYTYNIGSTPDEAIRETIRRHVDTDTTHPEGDT